MDELREQVSKLSQTVNNLQKIITILADIKVEECSCWDGCSCGAKDLKKLLTNLK